MKRLIYLLILLFFPSWSFSQSIFQAGRIKVEYVAGSALFVLKVNVELTAVPTQNPPSAVNLCWGDGNCEDISLIHSNLNGDHLLLNYQGFYTYPAEGTYVISAAPCCFTSVSTNIEDSGNKVFPLEVVYTFTNPADIGINNPTDFLSPLIDLAGNYEQYNFNPNHLDAEGDSIAYELVAPNIEDYSFPDEVTPFSVMEMDSVTGNLNWINPGVGIYHVAFKANEYRFGQLLSAQTVIMQIEILPFVSTEGVPSMEISTFPNPVKDYLILDAEERVHSNWQIQLFNAMGQLIKEQTWLEGSEKIEIPVHQLPNGPYWLKVSDGSQKSISKIFIKS